MPIRIAISKPVRWNFCYSTQLSTSQYVRVLGAHLSLYRFLLSLSLFCAHNAHPFIISWKNSTSSPRCLFPLQPLGAIFTVIFSFFYVPSDSSLTRHHMFHYCAFATQADILVGQARHACLLHPCY